MRVLIAHDWRMPKLMVGLLILELPLTVLCLVLMGVADPNTYRTKLWADGGKAGLNSNPNIILYSYANYKPLEPPLVWSQYMTTFNTVISVLSLFVLLVKTAMYTMHFFFPALSAVVHAILVALYANALYNQTAGDYLDTEHVARRPWYLTQSCKTYASPGNLGFCYQARASVYVTAVMVLLFSVYLGHAIWSAIPTEQERRERESEYLANIEIKKLSTYVGGGNDNEFEMDNKTVFLNLPKTPKTTTFGGLNPMTPRTTAFTRLNGGKAPEPRVVAISSPPSASASASASASTRSPTAASRALPFREQFGSSDNV